MGHLRCGKHEWPACVGSLCAINAGGAYVQVFEWLFGLYLLGTCHQQHDVVWEGEGVVGA